MIKRALHFQERLTGEPLLATIKRYFIFVIGGGIGFLILYGFHKFFRDSFGMNPIVSYAIGMVFAIMFTFVYHRLITFKVKTRTQERFINFSIAVVLIAVTNWGLFAIGRQVLNLPVSDFIMSFIITLVLSVVNFAINRIFIFRHH